MTEAGASNEEGELAAVKAMVQSLIKERLGTLHEEAVVLAADMEALLGRLACKGHVAKVDDLKAGRWYRTASDLRLLQEIYSYICATMGQKEERLMVPADDDTDGRVALSHDEDEVTEVGRLTPTHSRKT